MIYSLRNSDKLASQISKNLEQAGQNVRKYYQKRLPSNPSKDYYYILRDTPNNETLIVEYGFADSTKDDVNQIKNEWKILAESVVRAVTQYIGKKYIPNDQKNYYIVKSGDTLWNIAIKNNTSISEIKKLNKLTDNSLSIGQYLIIPNNEIVNDNYYIVKSGDTLWSIANKNNISVDKLKEINNLKSNSLSVGQKLLINKSNIEIPNTIKTYKVIKGDSLYNVALKFNTTVDKLKEINNLKSNILSIGQILKIPENIEFKTYIVKSGDSLYKIAMKFNTTVNNLKEINKLKSNLLSVGQVLKF